MKNNSKYKLNLLSNRKIFIVTVIIIVILAIFFGYISAAKKSENRIRELEEEIKRLSDPVSIYEEATKEIDIHVINTEIQNIGELASIEYLYTDAGKFEDPAEIFGKDIPFIFTTKTFIVKWDGTIKAGIDVSKVKADINEATKEIIVHIPKAKILSHNIKDGSIETLDEKNGLFNKIKIDDIRKFDAISKKEMEKRAIENGLLDKAFENSKEIIFRLIDTDIVEELEYTIKFKIIEE